MPVTLKCLVCGKDFKVKPSHVKKRHTCSNQCGYKRLYGSGNPNWKGAEKSTSCAICGKLFSFYPSVQIGKYCSLQCKHEGQRRLLLKRYEGKQKFATGENYSSTNSFRASVARHFRVVHLDKCAICGWDQTPNDICHIISSKEGGKDVLDNVVILCPNHHRMYDLGLMQREYIISLVRSQ